MLSKTKTDKELIRRTEYIQDKYGKKDFSIQELLAFRNDLVKKYGHKIVNREQEKLTNEEQVAQIEYKTLTNAMNKVSPKSFKILDWLIETTKGQIAVYVTVSIVSFIIALFFINTNELLFFLLFLLVALFNLIKALIIALRVVLRDGKEWWKFTEP